MLLYPWLQWPRCAAVCVRVCVNIHDINKYPFAVWPCKHIHIDGNACVWMDIYRYMCVDIYTSSSLSRFLFPRIFFQKYFESLCELCRCRPPSPSQKVSLCRTETLRRLLRRLTLQRAHVAHINLSRHLIKIFFMQLTRRWEDSNVGLGWWCTLEFVRRLRMRGFGLVVRPSISANTKCVGEEIFRGDEEILWEGKSPNCWGGHGEQATLRGFRFVMRPSTWANTLNRPLIDLGTDGLEPGNTTKMSEACMHACAHIHVCTHTHTHAHTRTHALTHTHTLTHPHTNALTHTHTHLVAHHNSQHKAHIQAAPPLPPPPYSHRVALQPQTKKRSYQTTLTPPPPPLPSYTHTPIHS